LDAIRHKKVLTINYNRSFNNLANSTFCPYFLKQFNSRWFLFGSDVDHPQRVTHLSLDRIISVEYAADFTYHDTEIDFDKDYFENLIGTTVPKNREILKVKLRFKPERLFYVETKPLHLSQKIYKKKQEVKIEVMHNKELESLILYFGDDVEVIEPESLRIVIKARIEKMYNLYQPIENQDIEVV
jgi:predicted DNA-binding transcriptional regulator YafY